MPKKRNKNNGILTFVQPETHSFMTDNLNLNLSYVGADSKSVATESHISLILSNLFPKMSSTQTGFYATYKCCIIYSNVKPTICVAHLLFTNCYVLFFPYTETTILLICGGRRSRELRL